MSKVTVVMPDGKEIGPVKVVGVKEIMTESGSMLQAAVYGAKTILPQGPSHLRFMAVYTNLDHVQVK